MKEKLSSSINKFGIPLLTVAATVAAAYNGTQDIPFNIASSLLTSVLGNKISDIEIFNKLKYCSPDRLNHDLNKVSVSAAKLAIMAISDSFEQDIIKTNKDSVDNDDYNLSNGKFQETKRLLLEYIESETWITKLKSEEIIKYESELKETDLLFENELIEKLKDVEDIFFNTSFSEYIKDHFKEKFQLYFREYLKKENKRPALIAYELETQKLILNFIDNNQKELAESLNITNNKIDILRKDLLGENIGLLITNEFDKQFKDLPVFNKFVESQDKITEEITKLNRYLETKIVALKEIKGDQLIIEVNNQGPITIDKNFNKLKEYLNDFYYFKFEDRIYFTTELTPESFDYLVGDITYNQIFIRHIIKAIEPSCCNFDDSIRDFYTRIKLQESDWFTNTAYISGGMSIIGKYFVGEIGLQLYKIFGIGRDDYKYQETEEVSRKQYIYLSIYIIKRTLDLVIFSLLSQLWDEVRSGRIRLSDREKLDKFFSVDLSLKEYLTLLQKLLAILKSQKLDQPVLLPEILEISECFEKNGDIYSCCLQLDALGKNPSKLDTYKAEKNLTVFFKRMYFLVNYQMTLMKKIEYLNIKEIEKGFIHHYVNVGHKSNPSCNFDNGEFLNSLFTNAILLHKRDDYTLNINLYPFVIDYNSLIGEKKSQIAFFKKKTFDDDCLEYSVVDNQKSLDIKFNDIVQNKKNKNDIYLNDNDIKEFNTDCVIRSFRSIEDKLFF